VKKANNLTLYIIIAMVAGVLLGYTVHTQSSPEFIAIFAERIKILTKIFLLLVQMIIAPLVFSTLVVGIAKLGDLKTVGRIGGKAMLWFISASLMSLTIGMILVNILKPGVGIDLDNADASAAADVLSKTQVFSLENFVVHLFPRSIFEALAQNEILQIVIFSILFGVATAGLGENGKVIAKGLHEVAHAILKMVG